MTRKKRKYKVATNPSLLTCLEPKSTNQRVYINSIHRSDIIFCSGPAGSGKTAIAKIQPYLIPVLEEMAKYLDAETLRIFRHSNVIELCPLEYMRGRNFHGSFMILDEAQNATFEQIKMFLTRIGRNSKAVVNGDLAQTDLPTDMRGGLNTCMTKLDELDGVSICKLEGTDIVRNDIIVKILNRLND